MNKNKISIIIVIAVLIIMFLPVSFSLFDGEPTDKFLSEIEILSDGSIKVRELIKMNGEYNGMDRDISYASYTNRAYNGEISAIEGNSTLYDGSSITDVKVGSISDDGDLTFDDFNRSVNYFDEVSYASNGTASKYTYDTFMNEVNLKLFNPSDLNEIFYIEYTVTDVVVVHEDIAELAWNTLGDGYRENIGDYEVKVILPSSDSDYRVWLHGPLNGEIEITNNKEALGTFNFLGAYNPVSVRLIFDKSLVPNATKTSGLIAKDAIIDYQTELSNEANREREKIQRQNMILIISSSIWGVIAIGLAVSVYLREKKMKKTAFNMEYFRDFPGSYGPEVLEYLLDKNVTEKSLSATILNLIHKKVLKVEVIDRKLKDDYKLILQEYDEASLSETEKIALNLIINEIGNSKEVVLSTIRKHCSTLSNANNVMDLYNDFIRKSKSLGKNEKFFAKTPGIVGFSVIFSLLGLILTFISFNLDLSWLGIIIIIIIIALIIFVITRKFYTKKGADHYAKWMAHKRFLEDFSRFNEKELPEVTLWDKYLVYAVVLDCADKLSKEMELKMPNMDTTDTTYVGYNPYMYHYFITSNIYSSINSGIHTAVASSRSSIAASHTSSGGGFGGGSIGGGGSFGGGGGGGRF
ncbi:MAG TPA: DUF2207 domain-containing protein [Candidatus Onthousia faecipullorum]|uniref:DUF2207 domain-containing protein n=1 Tax=Candidatus Onthousia faecipullorum TaxID=2840887 RepID=A0A9D1G9S4_9FIRM|nr:DUF2207 domain-containing protein [Candidatus Onthousia faecipullorum]